MDMKSFFNKILSGNTNTVTPTAVIDSFNKEFDNPINPEWTKTGDQYEAVFYTDELEHIVRYKANGERISLKTNLPLESVPVPIRSAALNHGELMNAIEIITTNTCKYELIVRDKELKRYFMLVSSAGEVIEKEKL